MPAPNLLLRALYYGLLLLVAASILFLRSRMMAPGLIFVILAVCAHATARIIGVSGTGKAMLFLEGLPFFALAVVHLGKWEVFSVLTIVASGAVVCAAILAGEWLLVKGSATFMTSLSFIGTCCVAGVGLNLLPTRVFFGLALLLLTIAGYGVARRVHG